MKINDFYFMKGLICYYSNTGNTKLACEYIAGKIQALEWEFFDIKCNKIPDFSLYDIAGFACFTDALAPSKLVYDFFKKLPRGDGRHAFVFNTYGFICGPTLKHLKKLALERGFKVIAGHSLHTPENYPPMVASGRGNEQAPNDKELRKFNDFIDRLKLLVDDIKVGNSEKPGKIDISLVNRIAPAMPRNMSKKIMGQLFVDPDLCIKCGLCAKSCPYNAIIMDLKPEFNEEKCFGCWTCFKQCPKKAIYTKKYRDRGHYPAPIKNLQEKLKSKS